MFTIDQSKIDCFDIEIEVTFSNRDFYKKQHFNDIIRIIITFLKIRNLNIYRHENSNYVIYNIHLKNTKNDKSITLMFRREIHLMNNFKANMFINNNIIEFENIIINSIKKQTFIINIDVIISIKIKLSKNNIQRSIHIRKIIIISSHIEIIMFINDINLSKNKDFLFESIDDVNFIFYVYLIDAFIFVVIIRNDHNQSIQISKIFKFDRISKLNYFNVFQISFEQTKKIKSLIVKKSKFTYKND